MPTLPIIRPSSSPVVKQLHVLTNPVSARYKQLGAVSLAPTGEH